MVGEFLDEEKKGIIPRSFDYIFKKIKDFQKEDEKIRFSIEISFIQIYLELIGDLFEPNNEVKIREDPEKGVYLEGVKWIKVESTKECAEAFVEGEKNRKTAETKMNATSSRSHALLIVKIKKKFNDKESNLHVMNESFLYLVDLAGSERVTKTNAKEDRLKEAKKINYSLLVLGNCIQALIDPKNNHVSYRDSKLTRILQESLGGNAKTSLIVTISPSSYNTEETISSLSFGARAMKVKNKPIINQTEDYQIQLIKLQEEYDKLNDNYIKLKIEYDKVCEENEKLKSGENIIEVKKNNIMEKLRNTEQLIGSIKNENNNKINQENEDLIKQKKVIEELTNFNINLQNDMENLQNYYNEEIKNKENKYNDLINKLDKINASKEEIIQELKNKNNNLKFNNKKLNEEKEEILKEKEGIMTSLSDTLQKNENLLLEIENLRKYNEDFEKQVEKFKQDKEFKKNNTKSISIQTPLLVEEEIKNNLTKLGISISIIAKNDVNSILKNLLKQLNKYIFDKNVLEKYKKENEQYKNVLQDNNELNLKNAKLKKEISSKENRINELEKKSQELINEINNLKSENEKNSKKQIEELNNLTKKYENSKNNLKDELSNNLENLLKLQKEINELNLCFINETNSQIENNLNVIKEKISKNENLLKDLHNNSINDENIENEISNKILDLKNCFYFIFNSNLELSKKLYKDIRDKKEKSNEKKNDNIKRNYFINAIDNNNNSFHSKNKIEEIKYTSKSNDKNNYNKTKLKRSALLPKRNNQNIITFTNKNLERYDSSFLEKGNIDILINEKDKELEALQAELKRIEEQQAKSKLKKKEK